MSDFTPDFRHMNADELRRNLTTLNFLVRDLRRFQASGDTRHLALWREGTAGAERAAAAFPSAALVTRLADMPGSVDDRGAWLLGHGLASEAEGLRKKYKEVWRSRPRETFRDIAERAQRKPKSRGWTFGR